MFVFNRCYAEINFFPPTGSTFATRRQNTLILLGVKSPGEGFLFGYGRGFDPLRSFRSDKGLVNALAACDSVQNDPAGLVSKRVIFHTDPFDGRFNAKLTILTTPIVILLISRPIEDIVNDVEGISSNIKVFLSEKRTLVKSYTFQAVLLDKK